MNLQVNDHLHLILPREEDRTPLFHLIERNRTHLKLWLPWLNDVQNEADATRFIASCLYQHKNKLGPMYFMHLDGALAGVCGFRPLDRSNRMGELGYWVDQTLQGRGLVTAACGKLIDYGFSFLYLNRIQISCGTDNHRSRAVAERLGFELEGVLRERELLYGRYVDHALYAMIKSQWKALRRSNDAP